MKKNVWILNHYASAMFFDKGGRHYWFAKFLRRAGYAPVVFCCNARHNGGGAPYFDTGALWEEHAAEEIETPFVFVRGRAYTGNGTQRVLNMIDFYRNVQTAAAEYAKAHGAPDVIYASSVHPLTLVAGIRLARRFGVPCISEARDLWPECIVEYSDRFTRSHPLMRLLYRGEKWIYEKSDALIFTWEGAYDYITERGWDKSIPREKVHYINNGVDVAMFDENRARFRADDPVLDDPSVFKAVYAGAVRRVNNLGLLLDAAKEFRDPRIRLLVYGDGSELDALRRRVADEGIQNVAFRGRVEKKYIPSITSRADLNIIHWEMTPVLRFGMSYNKLFEYMAAGKPVFSTVRSPYSIVEKYRCGADTAGFTPRELAEGIERLAALSGAERAVMGERARAAAADFDFEALTGRLIELIERTERKKRG